MCNEIPALVVPFCHAWGWEPTAAPLGSWMLLMRNEIPALMVRFCTRLASLAFAMAKRAARQRATWAYYTNSHTPIIYHTSMYVSTKIEAFTAKNCRNSAGA